MPANSVTDHVLALEKERLNCMHRSDVDRLRELLYPNYTFTHNNGMVEGIQPFLDRMESGEAHYHVAELSDLLVEQFGSCVIINGLIKVKVDVRSLNSTLELHNRFSSIWVKEQEAWRAAAYQSTPISS